MRLLPNDREIGAMPYAWLLYLVFLFITPIVRPGLGEWVVALGSIAIFLPLYFRNFWVQGPEAVVISSTIGALGALVLPFNWGGSSFFIYSAAFFGYATRPVRAALAVAILFAALSAESYVFRVPFFVWMPCAIGVVAIGLGNIHFAQLYRERVRVRQAQEQAQEMAKVAERERIGRDLHDLLGHTLSVIVMKSELASKLADRDPTRAASEIRDVERVSREALGEVRRAVEGYRQRGLPGELQNAKRALEAAGVRLEADLAPVLLPPRQETTLALVLRESVTNVLRHAQAHLCRVRLEADDHRIVFSVHDDGRGGRPREGNGIAGMRARVSEAGGTLTLRHEEGMHVMVTLPLEAIT